MLHQINFKAPQFYTDLGLQKTVLNPLANGKIQGLFKAFECFSSTFQGKFIFKDFSRQSCIFKYFSSLWETLIYMSKYMRFWYLPHLHKSLVDDIHCKARSSFWPEPSSTSIILCVQAVNALVSAHMCRLD